MLWLQQAGTGTQTACGTFTLSGRKNRETWGPWLQSMTVWWKCPHSSTAPIMKSMSAQVMKDLTGLFTQLFTLRHKSAFKHIDLWELADISSHYHILWSFFPPSYIDAAEFITQSLIGKLSNTCNSALQNSDLQNITILFVSFAFTVHKKMSVMLEDPKADVNDSVSVPAD